MPPSEHDTQHARHAVNETASVLASHRRDDGDDVTNTAASTLVNRKAAAKKRSYIKTRFVILITLFVFIIDFAFYLIDAPQIEILEHIICNAYYKIVFVDAVQSELAILTQFKDTLDMLPSLVLAIPYGILAETFGHKPIMLMSIVGVAAEVLIDGLICRWSVSL